MAAAQLLVGPLNSKPNIIISNSDHPLVALLGDYTKPFDTPLLKRIHARFLRLGLFFHPYSASKLLGACALSASPNLQYALQVFDQIPDPTLYSWNTIIRAHASGPNPALALRLFSQMLRLTLHAPDNFTYPFAIKAAAELAYPLTGAAVHGMALKSPFRSDVFILNSLVRFYSECGDPDSSFRVFDRIADRDVVSWNSMIAALARTGGSDRALGLFREMEGQGVTPNDITMVGVLSACGVKRDLKLGRSIHAYVERNGISGCLILSNAMLDMYAKCGSMPDVESLFDGMDERDSVSWTTMLNGYASSGDFDAAVRLFDAMPFHDDVAAWNALISGYEQGERPTDALVLFRQLLLRDDAKPDQVTLVAALSACAQLGALEMGCWIHAYVAKHDLGLNLHLTTSLIDMYSKCGDLEKALGVFRSVRRRDVFVWSATIAGLAMHGRGEDALNLFSQMAEAKVEPNSVTFMNLLCACSHAGLVDEGRRFFNEMLPVYGVAPQVEHYGCLVDILGRAGHLQEARGLIESMPMQTPASVWGALLGACVIHKNADLGELAGKHVLNLEPGNDGAYVLLSNLYAKSGNWDGVSKLRKLMRDSRIRKEPGRSSIEVHGVIHEFLVGDVSHPLSVRIYTKLDEMRTRLLAAGYVSDRGQVLQVVEEEDDGDRALSLHSERLAIAFGLLSIASPAPIRISKNIRVCEDCHTAAKFISSVYNREILLRDRYRFHRFKDGRCSCMDYW